MANFWDQTLENGAFQNSFGVPATPMEWMNAPWKPQTLDTPVQQIQNPSFTPKQNGNAQQTQPETQSGGVPWRPPEPPSPGGISDQPPDPVPYRSQGPKSYAEQVADNMNKPFLPEYNSLRYGKPLVFDGSDDRVSFLPGKPVGKNDGLNFSTMPGRGTIGIQDRPLTLAELDPTMVKEKDWPAYLAASVKAMSTATFDASKDPGVVQQMQSISNSYYRIKAAEKQKKAIEAQRQAVDDAALLVDAQAGMRDEQTDLAYERKRESDAKQAKQLRKQAVSIQEYLDKNGYSDEEKVQADKAREKLIQQAQALEEGPDDQEAKAAENSLWYRGEANKIRQQHVKIDEDEALTDTEREQAAQTTRLGYLQAMNVGQSQEESNAQQAENRAWVESQRQKQIEADRQFAETAPLKAQKKAEDEARARGMESIRSTRARANDLDAEYKHLEKDISRYDVGKDKDGKMIVASTDANAPELTEAQYREKKNRLDRLAKTRDLYRARANEFHVRLDPTYAALTSIPEEEVSPPEEDVQPTGFRRRSSPAATFTLPGR